MSAKDAIDVVGTREDNAVVELGDVDTIEIGNQTEIAERGRRFTGELQLQTNLLVERDSNRLRGGSKGKVVNLAQEQKRGTKVRTRINGAIVGSGAEAKGGGGQNRVDVRFPEATRFRVTLESMLDREDIGAVKGNAMAS